MSSHPNDAFASLFFLHGGENKTAGRDFCEDSELQRAAHLSPDVIREIQPKESDGSMQKAALEDVRKGRSGTCGNTAGGR